MQKIDLHQNILNSFNWKLDQFKNPIIDIKDSLSIVKDKTLAATLKNSWSLEDYKSANLQIVIAWIWPFERIFDSENKEKFNIKYSEKALEESLAWYEKIREENDIWLIKEKTDITTTQYIDFKLSFIYKLIWADWIKSLSDIDILYDKWIRIIQLVDENDNQLCSCYKNPNWWLSNFAKEFISYCENKKIIIDTANMNNQSMMETFLSSKKPILNSHTWALSIHKDQRNVSDEFLKLINQNESLIGISLNADLIVWKNKKANIDQLIQQIEYIKKYIDEDKIALWSCYHSSDYQNVVQGLESISDLKKLEEIMIEKFWYKFTNNFFRDNAYKFFTQYL